MIFGYDSVSDNEAGAFGAWADSYHLPRPLMPDDERQLRRPGALERAAHDL